MDNIKKLLIDVGAVFGWDYSILRKVGIISNVVICISATCTTSRQIYNDLNSEKVQMLRKLRIRVFRGSRLLIYNQSFQMHNIC